jgi:hypothetical protein
MQFTVITAEAMTQHDGSYEVLGNGVLVVRPKDESKPIVRLSPGFWRQIEESNTPFDPEEVGFH